jgi:2-keto-3-deoxygluconate permease
MKPFLVMATAQLATAIIVTAILCPLLVGFLEKRSKKQVPGIEGNETIIKPQPTLVE